MLTTKRMFSLLLAAVAGTACAAYAQDSGGSGNKTFQLGAETNKYVEQQGGGEYSYPAPKMMPVAPKQAPPPKKEKPLKASVNDNHMQLQGGAQQQQQRPPMQMNLQAQASPPPGQLPQQFFGRWAVQGTRTKAWGSNPQFQEAAATKVFGINNNQVWNIAGQPGHYAMSSDSGVTDIQVGNCTQTVAFIRYGHPVGNCTAQEAIVMQLSPDGRSFEGRERITIVKQGEGKRFEGEYKLYGQRQ